MDLTMSLEQYIALVAALYCFFLVFLMNVKNFRSAVIFKYFPFLLGLSLLWSIRDFII